MVKKKIEENKLLRATLGGTASNFINHNTFENRRNLLPRVNFLCIQVYFDKDICEVYE